MKRAPRPHETDAFWRDVERELDGIDPRDFQDFLEAQELPFEPRPEFERKLKHRLRRLLPD